MWRQFRAGFQSLTLHVALIAPYWQKRSLCQTFKVYQFIIIAQITEYQWEVEDLNLLKVILVETSLADWDKPCNIAAMVGKPCYAVSR